MQTSWTWKEEERGRGLSWIRVLKVTERLRGHSTPLRGCGIRWWISSWILSSSKESSRMNWKDFEISPVRASLILWKTGFMPHSTLSLIWGPDANPFSSKKPFKHVVHSIIRLARGISVPWGSCCHWRRSCSSCSCRRWRRKWNRTEYEGGGILNRGRGKACERFKSSCPWGKKSWIRSPPSERGFRKYKGESTFQFPVLNHRILAKY